MPSEYRINVTIEKVENDEESENETLFETSTFVVKDYERALYVIHAICAFTSALEELLNE